MSEIPLTEEPSSPFAGEEFALLLVQIGGAVADKRKLDVARALVSSGCRYAVCAGIDCDAWETAFDEADIEVNPECEEERFVMSTSHPIEPIAEVVRFFLENTATPHFVPTRFLVASVGGRATDLAALRDVVAAVWRVAAQQAVASDDPAAGTS